ncbi:DNA replication/repair protein RecF [Catenovulum sp. SM1970]|uniref:DNA replication/repair protein RecF n=1 Tax=Marinifaba aquimaris TaxID=2741323 RepID=UPI001573E8F4|nr:DNA replication/repair protein RecF [Marinifaba aquimaris]NTS76355.1 DNA replication/repair protein RecF [Marinifaba aquimaris]
MKINKLAVSNIRNIAQISLAPHDNCNLIVGANGSGKTSLLEAISMLGLGRSFRTNKHSELIRLGQEDFTIMAGAEVDDIQHKFGLRKSKQGDKEIRIDGETIRKQSVLSSYFPIVTCTPMTVELLDGSPSFRRKFIDWIVFHVEHQNISQLYKEFDRALAQRNQALKMNDRALVQAWDAKFIELNLSISELRKKVTDKIAPLVANFYRELANPAQDNAVTNKVLDIIYKQGWSDKAEFAEVLSGQIYSDLKRKTTQSGVHRDDIFVGFDSIAARQVLSRGELKLLVLSLLLAAETFIRNETAKTCIWLIDDIAAELDDATLTRLFNYFTSANNQIFISCVEKDKVNIVDKLNCEYSMFHVEHGEKVN